MNIDDIDFRPYWYLEYDGATISSDECLFFHVAWWYELKSDSARKYVDALGIYYNRFNNQMPVEIRKQLLRELERK